MRSVQGLQQEYRSLRQHSAQVQEHRFQLARSTGGNAARFAAGLLRGLL